MARPTATNRPVIATARPVVTSGQQASGTPLGLLLAFTVETTTEGSARPTASNRPVVA